MDWLAQALVSQLTWEIILMLGGGTLLGYLRKRLPEHASSIAYGIFGVTCVAVLLYTITGRGLMYRKPPESVTPENVEGNIKAWADHLAMSLERQPPEGDVFFSYVAHVRMADPVIIARAKEKPGYLQFAATLTASQEHQAILSKLNRHDYGKFLNDLSLELARLRMATGVVFRTDNRRGAEGNLVILLQKAVPIPDLSEGRFVEAFDDVSLASNEVRAAIRVALGTPPLSE
jgi:hypothetical protein